ncbi:MAG: hypothetical protein H7A23_11885 [Leptospiraceae bacterium]|nr:hypothetical protein [Leptospiraceae bacterium]MCP5495247.1 hypothetical protein [Leptospiraceae bacterium]
MPYYDNYEDDDSDYLDEEEDIVTYACEDCDYRWTPEESEEDDYSFEELICPMCGSSNVIEI